LSCHPERSEGSAFCFCRCLCRCLSGRHSAAQRRNPLLPFRGANAPLPRLRARLQPCRNDPSGKGLQPQRYAWKFRSRPPNLVKPPNPLNPSKQREKSLHINTPQLATIEVEVKK
jgi:hypothetical protein